MQEMEEEDVDDPIEDDTVFTLERQKIERCEFSLLELAAKVHQIPFIGDGGIRRTFPDEPEQQRELHEDDEDHHARKDVDAGTLDHPPAILATLRSIGVHGPARGNTSDDLRVRDVTIAHKKP